jgi:hypothetical protein
VSFTKEAAVANVALKVLGFPPIKPYGIVLQDPVSKRHCWFDLQPAYYSMLLGIFSNPGEPLLSHEVAWKVFQQAGVEITGIIGRLRADKQSIRFSIRFRIAGREEKFSVLSFDAFGYSIVSGMPITMSEEEFNVVAEMVPILEELGMTAPDRGRYGES